MRRTFCITVEDRPDGGLRVWSDDLPGLALSQLDHARVYANLGPAIAAVLDWPPAKGSFQEALLGFHVVRREVEAERARERVIDAVAGVVREQIREGGA